MRGSFLIATAALALAACQSPEEKRAAETGEIELTNASSEEVSRLMKAAAPKTAAKPGLWKAELHIDAIDGASGDAAAQLEATKRLERSVTECRTAEQLKPFDLSQLEKAAGTCTYVRYITKSGRVDVHIQCGGEGKPKIDLNIQGTSAPTNYAVTIENRTGTPGQPGYSYVKMRSSGTRLGECAATPKPAG